MTPALVGFLLLQTALPSNASVLEIVVGFALAILMGLNVWQVRTLRCVERDVVKMQHLIIGFDGTNGLYSKVKKHAERLDAIEDRHLGIDAVTAREREQYHGPERRLEARRLRDTLMPDLPPVDRGEE